VQRTKKQRPVILLFLIIAVFSVIVYASEKNNQLIGSWCLDEEDIIITFSENDSVSVTSESEDGVNGKGTFTKQDTMFVAKISNEDLLILMGYQYKWDTDSTINARTLFLSINGDTVQTEQRSVLMKRCKTNNE